MRIHTEKYKPKPTWHGDQGIGNRKLRTGACGRARCGLCHGYKFPWRKLTRKEAIQNLYSENE